MITEQPVVEIEQKDPVLAELEAAFAAQEAIEQSDDNSWVVEWYLKKLTEVEQLKSAMEERYKELQRQFTSRIKGLDYRFGMAFHVEADKLIKALKKGKSVKLLTGTVGYRTSVEKVEVADKDKMLAWAKQGVNPIDIRESGKFDVNILIADLPTALLEAALIDVKVSALKDYFKSTGELPDGCELKESEEVFYAKPLQLQLKAGNENG